MYYTRHPQYISILSPQTLSLLYSLDALLLDTYTKRIKLLPASAYAEIPRQDLRVWMHYRARYLLPTIELVNWLRTRIDGRHALEIGAGNSDLAYHLGIRAIDNGCQQYETVRYYLHSANQVPTYPSVDVLRMDAIQAILEFRPEVVIGAWMGDRTASSSPEDRLYSPDAYQIIQNADYIHIGTEKIHGKRKILAFSHETVPLPGLISRGESPPDDVIHIWQKLP